MDPRHLDRLTQKRNDPLERFREFVEFQLAVDGEGLGLRQAREDLAGTESTANLLMELDELAVASVVEVPYLNPALLEDDDARPLSRWWWHLGKLRTGRYPAELLPPHLRTVYRDALAHQAA